MGERWLTFRLWLGSLVVGNAAWGYYLQKVRDAKDAGAIPKNWPSNQVGKVNPDAFLGCLVQPRVSLVGLDNSLLGEPPKHAASPFDDNLPGRCCCCGLPTDLFQLGHWFCSICEGRGHNNVESAKMLGEKHDQAEDCKRLWKNYLDDLRRGGEL